MAQALEYSPGTAVMYISAAVAAVGLAGAAESRLAVDFGPWAEATEPAFVEVAT